MNTRILLQRLWACWRFATGYGLSIIVLLAADLAGAQEQPPAGNPIDVATLPRDLSPWGMYMQADIIVKAVMIGLAIASFVTWTVWLAKTIELIAAKRRLRVIYISVVDRQTMEQLREVVPGQCLMAISYWVDEVRLTDNMSL